MKRQVDPERDLLPAIRQALSPTAADQARVSSRLAALISAGGVGAYEPAPDAAPTKLGGLSQGLRGIGQQALAASLIGSVAFGVGYLTGREQTDGRQAAPLIRPAVAESSSTAVAPAPPPEPVPPQVHAPQAPAKKAVEAAAPPPDASAQTLSEEARELQRVDRALRAGMPLLALGILRDLDAKIPHGVFTEERTAARFIARCQNGDAGAREGATAWLAENRRSVYAARLQAACGIEPPSGENPP